jgi:putative hemolysin
MIIRKKIPKFADIVMTEKPMAEEEEKYFKIDIEEVISSKNPRLLKWVPGFAVRYLKRVLHQNDINNFLKANKDKDGVDFARAILEYFRIKINVIGLANVPKDGRFIFAANHPQGAIDSMALVSTVHEHKGELKFMVNDLLMFLVPLRSIFIPLNLFGKQSREAADLIDSVYKSEMQILYYPAGLVSRKKKGVIRDLEWKKTIISKARLYKRDVVPVYIHLRNSNFFYRLAAFRTFLGIKANIEMFYLVDELYKQIGNELTLVFGKPIPYQEFGTSSSSDKAMAEKLRLQIYELQKANQLDTL